MNGPVNSPLNLNCQYFYPNSGFTITFNGNTILSNIFANSQGSFIYDYTIPSNIKPGTYEIIATDYYYLNTIITTNFYFNSNYKISTGSII